MGADTIELGNEFRLRLFDADTDNGRILAFEFWHPRDTAKPIGDDGNECCCTVYLEAPTSWDVQRWAMTHDTQGRLTLSPSIICPNCGKHGWVVDGAWRDA